MLNPDQVRQRDGKLTGERLRELVDYDWQTGLFTRKRNDRGGGAPVGAVIGTKLPTGHIRISVDGKRYYAHCLAWLYVYGFLPPGFIDHKDNDPSNNRLANLRVADKQQNRANAKLQKNNTVGLKGVNRLKKSGRYHARIRVGGQTIVLGTFDTREEAHRAYLAAAQHHFGEFARGA